jgi:hypothetical protein
MASLGHMIRKAVQARNQGSRYAALVRTGVSRWASGVLQSTSIEFSVASVITAPSFAWVVQPAQDVQGRVGALFYA